ncbi:MAG: substrate binding domain-containing protein [Myxococcales bacterium]|nr:substrate binding domain-containing protein [Myxococcales bacterium]
MIAEFIASHSDITVELDATDRVVDLIEEGFDVAVRFGPLPESTLIARKLATFDGILSAAPSYSRSAARPRLIEEPDDQEKVLFFRSAPPPAGPLTDGDQSYEIGRPARFISNNLAAVRDVVLAGGGISVMTEFMVACDIQEGKLVSVLLGGGARSRSRPYPAQNLPPRLTLFLDHLAKSLNPPPWKHAPI